MNSWVAGRMWCPVQMLDYKAFSHLTDASQYLVFTPFWLTKTRYTVAVRKKYNEMRLTGHCCSPWPAWWDLQSLCYCPTAHCIFFDKLVHSMHIVRPCFHRRHRLTIGPSFMKMLTVCSSRGHPICHTANKRHHCGTVWSDCELGLCATSSNVSDPLSRPRLIARWSNWWHT